MKVSMIKRAAGLSVVLLLGSVGQGVWAHGTEKHEAKPADSTMAEQMPWGIAGQAPAVDRTIDVSMSDSMRFTPSSFTVSQGETLRFRVRNDGKLMHEFVIGTKASNAEHAALMVRFPNMVHDAPYMAHVEPGGVGEVVWTFNQPGEFQFACLIAGHYQAGMLGDIGVKPASIQKE